MTELEEQFSIYHFSLVIAELVAYCRKFRVQPLDCGFATQAEAEL
jgi:hypothetical protein